MALCGGSLYAVLAGAVVGLGGADYGVLHLHAVVHVLQTHGSHNLYGTGVHVACVYDLGICRRNAGNLPQNVKDQCSAVKKELKEVILFPKEAKGKTNQKKQG